MRVPAVTTVFHLVRHASHERVHRVLCGRMAGVCLSEAGRAEAARLAERLSREEIAAVRTSPLERARETAAPIAARLGLDAEATDAFTEIDFGSWTGSAFDALSGDPAWISWNTARGGARPPKGESMTEAQARALGQLEALRHGFPGKAVAVVSHCDVIRAVLLSCLGLPVDAYDRIEVAPASLSTIVLGDWGAKVIRINETVAA